MKILPNFKSFIDSTGEGTINAYNTVKNGAKRKYNSVKGFAKTQKDKFVNTNAVKTAKNFVGKNKNTIVGATVLVAGATLATACIKAIVDKIKEVKEK